MCGNRRLTVPPGHRRKFCVWGVGVRMQKLVGLDRRLSERSVQIRRFQNMESVLHGLPSAEGLFVASTGTDVVGDRSRPVTENQPAACKTPPPREEESRFGSLTPCVPCASAPVLRFLGLKKP